MRRFAELSRAFNKVRVLGKLLVFLPTAAKAFELGFLRNRRHLGRGVVHGGYTGAGQDPAAPIGQNRHATADDRRDHHAECKLSVTGKGNHNDAGEDRGHGIQLSLIHI